MVFLDFEKPIADLFASLEENKVAFEKGNAGAAAKIAELEGQIRETRKEIYRNLTPWQRVKASRHQDRPFTLDYIESLTNGSFVELHGDRTVGDDKAMVGGFGMVNGVSVMLIGHQKGNNTKMRQYRNFGMPNPEGYRKALRLMKLAEKFNKPVITFIDTPGAFPGIEAEQRGQSEAIARNLFEMVKLKVPVICFVIGEGASGGALGIGVGDRVYMLENTWYSVISPESCSSILWHNWEKKEIAASMLKLTPQDMLAQGLIDKVINEPVGGAHADRKEMFATMKAEIIRNIEELKREDADTLVKKRMDKFVGMGVYHEL